MQIIPSNIGTSAGVKSRGDAAPTAQQPEPTINNRFCAAVREGKFERAFTLLTSAASTLDGGRVIQSEFVAVFLERMAEIPKLALDNKEFILETLQLAKTIPAWKEAIEGMLNAPKVVLASDDPTSKLLYPTQVYQCTVPDELLPYLAVTGFELKEPEGPRWTMPTEKPNKISLG